MRYHNVETIAIFSAIIICFGIIIFNYGDQIPEEVYSILFTFPLGVAAILSFSLFRLYRDVPRFCYSHLVLCIAMIFFVIAETIWIVLAYFGTYPYPSPADVAYGLYFGFLILYPTLILKFFETKPKIEHHAVVAATVAVCLTLYMVFTPQSEGFWVWLNGLIFIAMSSTLLGVTVMTTLLLRNRQVFAFWIILGVAFLINCLADLHYYSSENWSDWEVSDFVNIMWFISSIMVIYALLQHKRMYHALVR